MTATTTKRALVAWVLMLMVATACGSTVQYRPGQNGANGGAPPGDLNSGLGLPGPAGGAGVGPGGAPAGGAGSFPTGAGLPGATGSFGTTAQGVYKDKILIGVVRAVDSDTANQALGAGGATLGDYTGEQVAIIDDINKHGGVLGRKLVPVWHTVEGTYAGTYAQLAGEKCETWRSAHVFAAFDGGDEDLLQCLTKAGIIAIKDDVTEASDAWFQRYPLYVEPSSIDVDRIAKTQIPALAAQNYFSPWNKTLGQPGTSKAKVGIVAYDTSAFKHAIQTELRPALRSRGYDAANADVIWISPLEGTSGLGAEASQVSGAVLKLNSDGVDHVQILDVQARLTLEFLREAGSQQYYPRYGLNSQNGVQALLDLEANGQKAHAITPKQVAGAVGFGWSPYPDIRDSENTDNGPFSNKARRDCLKMFKEHGVTYDSANAEAAALGLCNDFYFFRQALTRGGANISRNSWLAGVNSLASSFQSTSTFMTYFRPGQHDGGAGIRYMGVQQSCGCVRYTSDVINIG